MGDGYSPINATTCRLARHKSGINKNSRKLNAIAFSEDTLTSFIINTNVTSLVPMPDMEIGSTDPMVTQPQVRCHKTRIQIKHNTKQDECSENICRSAQYEYA